VYTPFSRKPNGEPIGPMKVRWSRLVIKAFLVAEQLEVRMVVRTRVKSGCILLRLLLELLSELLQLLCFVYSWLFS